MLLCGFHVSETGLSKQAEAPRLKLHGHPWWPTCHPSHWLVAYNWLSDQEYQQLNNRFKEIGKSLWLCNSTKAFSHGHNSLFPSYASDTHFSLCSFIYQIHTDHTSTHPLHTPESQHKHHCLQRPDCLYSSINCYLPSAKACTLQGTLQLQCRWHALNLTCLACFPSLPVPCAFDTLSS